jgi:hypothetical protein
MKEGSVTLTKKQAELMKQVLWMGILWGKSLIDAKVKNGKTDLRTAAIAYELIKKKLNNE